MAADGVWGFFRRRLDVDAPFGGHALAAAQDVPNALLRNGLAKQLRQFPGKPGLTSHGLNCCFERFPGACQIAHGCQRYKDRCFSSTTILGKKAHNILCIA